MWLLARLHGALPAFHERGAVWLDGRLDVQRLRRAIAALVARHEILRTTFAEREGQPVQVISPPVPGELPELHEINIELDRTTNLDSDADARALAAARAEVSVPFDLEDGPLFRVSLIRLRSERHLLALSMHHIISDGDPSISLFFKDLIALYENRELPALPLQYQGYTRWQRERIRGERIEAQLGYWLQELADAQTTLELPSDRPRPALQTFAGGTIERVLDPGLTAGLAALGQGEGVELFSVLLAGLQGLLHRYTRQPDVLVGTPLPGRDHPEGAGLIGYFGNPVVMRGRFAAAPSFRALVRQLDRAVQSGRHNGEVSFKTLVERLAPPRDSSRPPIFQILFDFRRPRAEIEGGPALGVTPVDVELPHVSYDLIFSVQRVEGALCARAEYNRQLYDAGTIERLLMHWERLLRAGLLAPDERLSRLRLLDEAERRGILLDWNRSPTPPAPHERVHTLFAARARANPDAPALQFDGQRLSYGELDRRSNQVAHLLRGCGVGPDVLVGLCMERSADLIVAMLGTLKAGGAYVPLDPSYPPERLAFMLEDTALRVLLTEERLLGCLPPPAPGLARICFDADRERIEQQPQHPVAALPGEGPENLAYVMYTSGSTGRPKGTLVEHRNILSLLVNTDYVIFGPEDRVAQAANSSFDAATFEIWGALLHGALLIGIAREITLTPPLLAQHLREQKITTMFLATALFNQAADLKGAFAPLRNLVCGGEALDPDSVRKMLAGGPPDRFVNGYGPTETTTFATWFLVREVARDATSIPLGRPIAHSRIYVLDEHLEPVPFGVTGEIYIGGDGVGRGYLNRPELTAARFLPDPFTESPERPGRAESETPKMYRTGDLGRLRADGVLEFLGRADSQVKIRGFRVELGEIEVALRQHAAVRETVVRAVTAGPRDKKLVAYVVFDPAQLEAGGEAALLTELRTFLVGRLPDYMIPFVFVPLPALPLTPNGKIDSARLPLPDSSRPETGRTFVAPRSELEQSLAEIWQEILHLSRIGVHDNFFELGGHSLHAVQLFSRVREAFGIDTKFQVFFSHPTIAELAALLGKERPAARREAPILPVPRDKGARLPLSFGEERLWFLQRLSPESRAYNCVFPFRLRGPLDQRALERCLRELVRRHEILRTTYQADSSGRPFRTVDERGAVRLDVADLQHLSQDAREPVAIALIAAEGQRIFDLEHGPLLRAGLLKLGPEDHVLWLHFHHLTMDGWSTEVAFGDLRLLYEGAQKGREPELAQLPIQYADFAAWQREQLSGANLEALLGWWTARLADAPPLLALPSDRARPAVQSFRGSTAPFHLPPELAESLRALSVQQDMTTTMVLLAAFAVLLSRYTRSEDVLIGMPSANRKRLELERVMGFFVNTLPIRVDLSGAPTFTELLRRVRSVCVEAYDHDALPFEQLVQALRVERTTSYNPVVQVAFAPQPPAGRDLRLAGTTTQHLDVDVKKTIFDLALYSWEGAEGVVGMVEYSTDLFEAPTIQRLVRHLFELLSSFCADPDRPVSTATLLSEAERQQLLVEWNRTDASFDLERTVLHRFEEQVARAPSAIAVQTERGSLSYGELDRRANQLGQELRGLGVGAESVVGILADRSLELVVGILGVLKAGGAYAPLDPKHARERLVRMLADLRPRAILTQAALRERLPEPSALSGPVLCLDADWARIAQQPESAPPRDIGPEQLAYIIFTSGSTGRPNGVQLEHRGLSNLVAWHQRRFSITPADRATLVASPGFDASVWELWPYLCAGATLCIPGEMIHLSPTELREWLIAQRITVSFQPTPVAEQLLRLAWPAGGALRVLLTGGDALRAFPDPALPFEVVNNYGPTEATVVTTSCSLRRGADSGTPVAPPIGRPIHNLRVYLLDPQRQLVPVGVAGELFIGGVGLARGYLDRPELTAARFVSDPFSDRPGARLYRTGDLARWLPDGSIEFLGRIDSQVKLRGFRIELGEIESVLREHPAVQEAVVIVDGTAPADKRLVAYVVPGHKGDAGADELHSGHVSDWRALYDDTYEKDSERADVAFNITGWNSSFTGAPIEPEVMRAWRDHTVRRIRDLGPRRVWEIGCGTGLLLSQLAPGSEAYLGTDFSQRAISLLEPHRVGPLSHVALRCCEASDFTGVAPQSFDTIVLNSIIQYFPDASYLRAVLHGAVRATAPGGVVFVGDVRSLPLLEAFHGVVRSHQAAATTTLAEHLDGVRRGALAEEELVLAPDYFHHECNNLPGVAHVEIWLKRGTCADEMTRFRYDAVIFVGEALEPVPITRSLDAAQLGGGALAAIERCLQDERPEACEVLGLPNARVHADVAALEVLRAARGSHELLASVSLPGHDGAIEPEALFTLGERLGYAVRVTWSRSAGPGCMDVLFERAQDPRTKGRMRAWVQPVRAPQDTPLVNNPLRAKQERALLPTLREFLATRLPEYMIPAAIVKLDALPLTTNGKVDRRALPALQRDKPAEVRATGGTRSEIEEGLLTIWRSVLDVRDIGLDDRFFDLGGHSLLLVKVQAGIQSQLGRVIPIVDLFRHPTIRSCAAHLSTTAAPAAAESQPPSPAAAPERVLRPELAAPAAVPKDAVAIIGMAGRFPKARNVEQLWDNLIRGVEGISFYSPEELRAAGVAQEFIRSPRLVPATGVLEDAFCFDAGFFGFSPGEAKLMDPQQRVLLECAWEALERAGYNPFTHAGPIGVFAGCDAPNYWLERIGFLRGPMGFEHYRAQIANATDCLATRVAYKLGLRGPALTVLSACSTSLVAIHLACQSLLLGECEMAMAGAAVVLPPSRSGHMYEEGVVLSPDGHCRPYDSEAMGTVNGSGTALVVLKRLSAALRDGDTIHAVVRGSAVQNDGAQKVGFMAPGEDGQYATIVRAQAAAGVDPETITFVEGHGTGTKLGDPIEVAALTRAFRRSTDKVGFCALGSVKSNLGHLGSAAGVTGVIKAVMALEHERIPPTLHFKRPNPELELLSSPFFVNAQPLDWKRGASPRRAAVSAFGIGGTNGHVILEEAPERGPSGPSRSQQLLVLSARSKPALEALTDRLAAALRSSPQVPLADVAFTLQQGRVPLAHRRVIVSSEALTAAALLERRDPATVHTGVAAERAPTLVYMFPGGGTQRPEMGKALYQSEPVYRESFDRCADLFLKELGIDLRTVLFPSADAIPQAAEQLLRPGLNLAAIFSTEYALAQLLLSWNLRPSALTGHSLGEYTAACLAGVLSLEDTVALLGLRGRLHEEVSHDALTFIVYLAESEIVRRLPAGLSLAAVNAPQICLVSGRGQELLRFAAELEAEGHTVKRLPVAGASHSSLIEPLMHRLTERAAAMQRNPPRIPMISNLTGRWMTDAEATDPTYWARHLRGTVRFADGVATLLKDPAHVFVEVGPSKTLLTLTSRHPAFGAERRAVHTMASPGSERGDLEVLLHALGQLFCAGVALDGSQLWRGEQRRRVPLPTYPFERTPYVFEGSPAAREGAAQQVAAEDSRPVLPVRTQEDLSEEVAHIDARLQRLRAVLPAGAERGLLGASASPAAIYVRTLREVIGRVLRRAGGPVRLLEIGGAEGQLTRQLAPQLEGHEVEYWFTDSDKDQVARAEGWARREALDFVKCATLDLALDAAAQGHEAASFEVVVGLNGLSALHRATGLDVTLRHVRKLLVPGGLLILVERSGTEPLGAAEPGEGRISEDLRFRTAGLRFTAAAWEDLFQAQGFQRAHVHPTADSERALADYVLIVAQEKRASAALPVLSEPAGMAEPAALAEPAGMAEPAALAEPSSLSPSLSDRGQASPRSELERTIAGGFEQLLGLDSVELHDNFFDLGGDSLTAIRLVNKLREVLDIHIDSHALLKMPTVAMLSAWLQTQREPRPSEPAPVQVPSSLVEIQSGRAEQPLFLVHPVGGHVYCYLELARQLRLPRAIYGLRSSSVDPQQPVVQQSIEEMARGYLEQIRAVQKDGPYSIGGYSFGGIVAIEMARQLLAEGKRVAAPILIDSAAPTESWVIPDELDPDLLARFAADLGLISQSEWAERSAALRRLPSEHRLDSLLELTRRSALELQVVDAQHLKRLLRAFVGNMRALSRYKLRPYPGSIVLLRADDPSFSTLTHETDSEESLQEQGHDPTMGWGAYVKGSVESHSVPGNHYTVLKQPGVRVIAEVLRRHLRAQPPSASPPGILEEVSLRGA